MNIAVYLGSSSGNDPVYGKEVYKLGEWIASNGYTLVYGGSHMGLMGLCADGALSKNGHVIGVEPKFFIDAEVQHSSLTELIVTKDMAERKARMIELSDAFIAYPGGIGTLEEISEIMSLHNLNHTKCPCIFFNVNHYYDPMKALLQHMLNEGFLRETTYQRIHFADSIEEISLLLEQCAK